MNIWVELLRHHSQAFFAYGFIVSVYQYPISIVEYTRRLP